MSAQYLIIRDANPEDCTALVYDSMCAWRHPKVSHGAIETTSNAPLAREDWGRHANTDVTVLVAELSGGLVGHVAFGAASRVAGAPATVGRIYSLHTDPEHRGRGVGRVLLRRAEASLWALGYTEAVMWISSDAPSVRALCESEGWVVDLTVSAEARGEAILYRTTAEH